MHYEYVFRVLVKDLAATVVAAANGAVGLYPKMAKALQVRQLPPQSLIPVAGNSSLYFVDFGREFQGGLSLSTNLGRTGTKVKITAGESRLFPFPKNKTDKGPVTQYVGDTWGFEFSWVLRDGSQLLEQHQYMEFRYLNLEFTDNTGAAISPPDDLEICAWLVQYEWDPHSTRHRDCVQFKQCDA